MTTTSSYGSWRSPISALDLASTGHPVSNGTWVGDDVWWLELRYGESGRLAVRTTGANGKPIDILPAPWNARTRVHEYGGGSWAVTDDAVLVFTEFTDQRLYRLDPGETQPVALTSAGRGFRFGDLSIRNGEIIAVRETHASEGHGTDSGAAGDVARDIVAVPLDGSADGTDEAIRSIVAGSHFLAFPRFSPDGSRFAWIAWEHPQMPWDGTELRVAELEAGRASGWRTIAGSETESILQPEWLDDETLVAISDREGWWNLVRIGLDGARTRLQQEQAEFGGPLWMLGARWYDLLDDGRILAVRTLGSDTLVVLDPSAGTSDELTLPLLTMSLGARRGNRILLNGGGANVAAGLRVLQIPAKIPGDALRGDAVLDDIRLNVDELPDAAYLPQPEARTFRSAGNRDVHSFVYPPRNAEFVAPDGELPPYVAFVHGGPTSRVSGGYDPTIAYFTSRGIGVVNINYGGSTGYGREYRERLRGQWGIVDVEDTVATMLGLADAGVADRDRLAIRGGSAGGWTVLASLTTSDIFAAGTSYFGVAELTQFARDTHDFESRYLDGLIGPLPEAEALYRSRAPLNNVHRLTTPVLLLQGLDDPVVPPSQAEMFRDALEERGIRHAYIAYEGESHGFRRAETIVDATESELSFYGQVMGFEPADVPRLKLAGDGSSKSRP